MNFLRLAGDGKLGFGKLGFGSLGTLNKPPILFQ
jgi:hypothetical protein